MVRSILWTFAACFSCLASGPLVLAGPPVAFVAHGDHHHHHLSEKDVAMPKDYPAAIARIKKCRATIGQEIAAGHLNAVHAPLDEATIILSKLPAIARDSGVPKAQWQEINLAAKDLKKRLADLHMAIDANRKFDFKAVAGPMDQVIRQLELIAKAPGKTLTR